jgi:hypothetical protein
MGSIPVLSTIFQGEREPRVCRLGQGCYREMDPIELSQTTLRCAIDVMEDAIGSARPWLGLQLLEMLRFPEETCDDLE